jgi:UDP-3-O-[3-hydroxymyristoyl] glucosamine N-acyltransferase
MSMPAVAIGEIVDFVDGQYVGDRGRQVSAVAPLAEASEDQLSFLSNRKYAAQLGQTKAGAILVPQNLEGDDERWIRVEHPHFAMPPGISPQAVIAPGARVGANVSIGPFVVIGEEVVIGDETIIYPNVVIYAGTRIGNRCIIHASAVIGSDGYGFVTHKGKHHKIPQTGIVRVEDDVEIGAGTTIDRATFGETVIGEGTKIDNLVQIAHNVRIGKHCLLTAHVGVAGSTELGDYVFAGGQSGFIDHLKIGNRVQVAAKSAVFDDIPDDTKVIGSPAIPFRDFVRRQVALKRLVPKKE